LPWTDGWGVDRADTKGYEPQIQIRAAGGRETTPLIGKAEAIERRVPRAPAFIQGTPIIERPHLASTGADASFHCRHAPFFFTLVTGPRRSLRLKLSDTRVYAPQIRVRLGTTAHFCEVFTPSPYALPPPLMPASYSLQPPELSGRGIERSERVEREYLLNV